MQVWIEEDCASCCDLVDGRVEDLLGVLETKKSLLGHLRPTCTEVALVDPAATVRAGLAVLATLMTLAVKIELVVMHGCDVMKEMGKVV